MKKEAKDNQPAKPVTLDEFMHDRLQLGKDITALLNQFEVRYPRFFVDSITLRICESGGEAGRVTGARVKLKEII